MKTRKDAGTRGARFRSATAHIRTVTEGGDNHFGECDASVAGLRSVALVPVPSPRRPDASGRRWKCRSVSMIRTTYQMRRQSVLLRRLAIDTHDRYLYLIMAMALRALRRRRRPRFSVGRYTEDHAREWHWVRCRNDRTPALSAALDGRRLGNPLARAVSGGPSPHPRPGPLGRRCHQAASGWSTTMLSIFIRVCRSAPRSWCSINSGAGGAHCHRPNDAHFASGISAPTV